jgi:transcriptional regulator with XRE-family HTH domain
MPSRFVKHAGADRGGAVRRPCAGDGIDMNEHDDDVGGAPDPYSRKVGERLRAIRRQKRLSLQEVEAKSNQEFKASVLGAYERGERAISVPRLQRLSRFYSVPVEQLLPVDDGPDFGIETPVVIDLTDRPSRQPGLQRPRANHPPRRSPGTCGDPRHWRRRRGQPTRRPRFELPAQRVERLLSAPQWMVR